MNIGYNDTVSYCWTIDAPWSQPMKEDTKQRLLNIGSMSKLTYYIFYFNKFLQEGKKTI
jgi:hypothetical protein